MVNEENMIEAESNEPKVYQILPENMNDLTSGIAKLNKRAAKLGTEPISFTVVGEKFVTVQGKGDEYYDEYLGRMVVTPGSSHLEKRILVTVSGKAPKLNGWAIAAVIEHTDGGNILRAVPPFTTESFDVTFRTSAPICDHCGYDRKRKDTYIVRNDDGRQAQVGRTCLKDFTGHKSPEAIAMWAELIACLDDMVEGFGGEGHGEHYYSLAEVLQTSATVVRMDGFMSKSRARELSQMGKEVSSSASTVAWLLSPTLGIGRAAEKERVAKAAYKIEDADKAQAELAQGWAATQDADITNDYLWNLRVVANMEAITSRNFGLAVSMISAYQRECDRLAGIVYVKGEKKVRPISQFVGTIGKRSQFTITLKALVALEGAYGPKTLHIMEDEAGNNLTWFKTGHSDMEKGGKYVIEGRVERHEPYTNKEGVTSNQTQVSRCKVVKDLPPAVVDETVMNVFA